MPTLDREQTPGGLDVSLEEATRALLEATRSLVRAVDGNASAESLAEAYAERVACFDVLRAVQRDGDRLGDASIGHLAEIRTLDSALMRLGREEKSSIRGERRELARRRTAIDAHSAREREAPRFVAVKA